MLVNILISIINMLMAFLKFAIPNWFIPDSIQEGFAFMIDEALKFNGVIPMSAILLCISVILWFHIIRITFNLMSGFISIIRGGGKMEV